ncbi:hypothetical protein ANN_08110 [Periplaneta americana]|uniref:Uncharacterized protein n=1 Tax=Periplaneta americana TaxID=6978 RepID=A0ABQ8T0I9_PERAM|nr:hypothetical protein ANN_08110 [Periplaneta americana]
MVNGRRVRDRRRYQMTNDINIWAYGLYEETKKKTREELAHTRHELNSTQEEMKRLVKENDHLKQEARKDASYCHPLHKRRSRDEWLQLFRNEAKKDDSGPGIATKKVNRELPEGRITAAKVVALIEGGNGQRYVAAVLGILDRPYNKCTIALERQEVIPGDPVQGENE